MITASRIAIIAIVLSVLSGCATFKTQAFNRSAHPDLKRVAVLPMPQANVRLMVYNATGNNFGLIGALITEADRNSKENWLQEEVKKAGFNQFEIFQTAFSAAMTERGYQLTFPTPLTHPEKDVARDKYGLRKRYAPAADAQLDIGVEFVGYAAAGSGKDQPYRPTVLVSVRLLDASGKNVLYQDQFQYHNVRNVKTSVVIEPNPAYRYPNFDDLKLAGATSITGLDEAVRKTADAIAKQL